MAELKRYLNWCQPTHGHEMTEDSEGPWVAYEDYERLRADCARFITANTEVGALNVEQAETIARLRAALERSERVSAMVSALPVTTEELRRIRNAGKLTFDRMVNAIMTCLIDMREALGATVETAACTHDWTLQVDKADFAIYCCENCGKFVKRIKETQPCPDQ